MPINAKAVYDKYFGYGPTAFHDLYGVNTGIYNDPLSQVVMPDIGNMGPDSVKYWFNQFGNVRIGQKLKERSESDQLDCDVAMMYGTLIKGGGAAGLLKRIFTVLHFGGLMSFLKMGSSGGYSPWADSGLPLAGVLARGGRFTIQIPAGTGDTFFNWLQGTDKIIEKNQRGGATHNIKPIKDFSQHKHIGHNRFLRIDEGHGATAGLGHIHYGVNVGMGGVGNYNPISGNKIASDGEHGHIYVFYEAPTDDLPGGLLIGIEGSAPVDAWDNRNDNLMAKASFIPKFEGDEFQNIRLKGTKQIIGNVGFGEFLKVFARDQMKMKFLTPNAEKWTPDQYGGKHTLGGGQDFGVTGSLKWEKCSNGPAAKYNAQIVDLTIVGIDAFVNDRYDFKPEYVGDSGERPSPIVLQRIPIFEKTYFTSQNINKVIKLIEAQVEMESKKHKSKLSGNAIKNHREAFSMNRNALSTVLEESSSFLSIEDWKSLSSVFASSRNTIAPVDEALRKVLNKTRDCLNYTRVSADPFFTEYLTLKRKEYILPLLNAIVEYQSAGSDKKRLMAVEALKQICAQELTSINKIFANKVTGMTRTTKDMMMEMQNLTIK